MKKSYFSIDRTGKKISPSQWVNFIDNGTQYDDAKKTKYQNPYVPIAYNTSDWTSETNRGIPTVFHSGQLNLAAFDGHAASVRPETLGSDWYTFYTITWSSNFVAYKAANWIIRNL